VRVKAFVPGWARVAEIVPAKSREKKILPESATALDWVVPVLVQQTHMRTPKQFQREVSLSF
jgi:uncharacterized protein YktA (UPF0223 family)